MGGAGGTDWRRRASCGASLWTGGMLGSGRRLRLARSLHEAHPDVATSGERRPVLSLATVRQALGSYASLGARARAWSLVYISRWCGDAYMHNMPWLNWGLQLCLVFPFNLVFIVVMKVLLFWAQRDLRTFAEAHLTAKRTRTG